jgi:hypothetical protein
MKLTFTYEREKDILCILNYGKTSFNSQASTKVYEQLISQSGDIPTEKEVSEFIDKYLVMNQVSIEAYLIEYQKDWAIIEEQYTQRAESIFKVSLQNNVTTYLTINNRCPYSIEENLFFASIPAYSMRKTAMHELWHFYTWYAFGIMWEEKIGKQEYNDIKEALTVLLNVECKDLLPEGITDNGYLQHRELRQKILEIWNQEKDIEKLWAILIA